MMPENPLPAPAIADASALQPPLPLLITGIAGVAGYNAFHYFRARYPGQVIGTRRADNRRLTGEGVAACDIHDPARLESLFERHSFASVLNAEGTCALRSCELDPPLAWRINVLGVANLLRLLQPTTRLVHLSVDLVFSGNGAGDYREADPTDPVTVYGKTMRQSERLILDSHPAATVLRISLPMGISFNGHAGAIDWIQARFQASKPATLYYDEVRTPTYTDCLNRTLERILTAPNRGNGPFAGLFHAGGTRQLSLYQIAQIVNRIGGYDPDLLIGCPRQAAGPIPPRAGNVTLDSSRLATQLGSAPFTPWPLDGSQVPTDRQWHHMRQGDESPDLLVNTLYRNPAYPGNDQERPGTGHH